MAQINKNESTTGNRGVGEPDRNPDPITGAPGSHPVGTGIGTASGALSGAALGMIGGPIGAAIGLIAGGVTGAVIGHEAGEYNDPTEDWSESYKEKPYYNANHDYKRDVAPAHRYGSTLGQSVRGQKKSGDDAGMLESMTNNKDDGKPGTVVSRALGMTDANDGSNEAHGYETYENDIRGGWDKVKGNSSLTYEQARDAIRDAYDQTIQLRRENLNVSKDQVQRGEATVRKEVITEHQTVDVPVSREELVIERKQVNRTVSGEIGANADSETVRIPLKEERVNVSKDTVVEEEVTVGKRQVTDTKKVEADVRHEELRTSDVDLPEGSRTPAGTKGRDNV